MKRIVMQSASLRRATPNASDPLAVMKAAHAGGVPEKVHLELHGEWDLDKKADLALVGEFLAKAFPQVGGQRVNISARFTFVPAVEKLETATRLAKQAPAPNPVWTPKPATAYSTEMEKVLNDMEIISAGRAAGGLSLSDEQMGKLLKSTIAMRQKKEEQRREKRRLRPL
jgi:hypothetical protein